ncbi:MAG: hypothetical protein HYR90_00195 [Candidatus Andersenbacteria bacterium]|nr:hypothetical protein [Candidatus Andersenbacteria bacterium]MBI3250660.1 hypothetical protein [Candidatus Andersenbacteria bacterium]
MKKSFRICVIAVVFAIAMAIGWTTLPTSNTDDSKQAGPTQPAIPSTTALTTPSPAPAAPAPTTVAPSTTSPAGVATNAAATVPQSIDVRDLFIEAARVQREEGARIAQALPTSSKEELTRQAFEFFFPQVAEHGKKLGEHEEKLGKQQTTLENHESRLKTLESDKSPPATNFGDNFEKDVVERLERIERSSLRVESKVETLTNAVASYREAAQAEFGVNWQDPSRLCMVAQLSVNEALSKSPPSSEDDCCERIVSVIKELIHSCDSPAVKKTVETISLPTSTLPPQTMNTAYAWPCRPVQWYWDPCSGRFYYCW